MSRIKIKNTSIMRPNARAFVFTCSHKAPSNSTPHLARDLIRALGHRADPAVLRADPHLRCRGGRGAAQRRRPPRVGVRLDGLENLYRGWHGSRIGGEERAIHVEVVHERHGWRSRSFGGRRGGVSFGRLGGRSFGRRTRHAEGAGGQRSGGRRRQHLPHVAARAALLLYVHARHDEAPAARRTRHRT